MEVSQGLSEKRALEVLLKYLTPHTYLISILGSRRQLSRVYSYSKPLSTALLLPKLLFYAQLSPFLIASILSAISIIIKPLNLTTLRIQLFKRSIYSTTVTLRLKCSNKIVRHAPEKTCLDLANIASIERILIVMRKRRRQRLY